MAAVGKTAKGFSFRNLWLIVAELSDFPSFAALSPSWIVLFGEPLEVLLV
jgi:hypothetical protein